VYLQEGSIYYTELLKFTEVAGKFGFPVAVFGQVQGVEALTGNCDVECDLRFWGHTTWLFEEYKESCFGSIRAYLDESERVRIGPNSRVYIPLKRRSLAGFRVLEKRGLVVRNRFDHGFPEKPGKAQEGISQKRSDLKW
jgi:hypothetical protein